jgi:hypothetical protein
MKWRSWMKTMVRRYKMLQRVTQASPPLRRQWIFTITFLIVAFLGFAIFLTSCGSAGQSQPDPRLKWFHIVSSRISILNDQAEVDGTIQNTGSERYPFDVTIYAAFYDRVGNMIGKAEGVAEDVSPGMTRAFILKGQVDSLHYSHMQLTLVSLKEQHREKNLPDDPTR